MKKTMRRKSRSHKKKGGGCGCNTTNLQSGGSSFVIPATSIIPASYPLNQLTNDPNMQQVSTRMQKLVGGKRKRTNRAKKHKRKHTKTKKQKGGINLGYVAQNSTFGHGHYGTWFGAPTANAPDWNSSIFTKPNSIHNTGFNEHNPYLV